MSRPNDRECGVQDCMWRGKADHAHTVAGVIALKPSHRWHEHFFKSNIEDRPDEIRKWLVVAILSIVAVFGVLGLQTWRDGNRPGGQLDQIKQNAVEASGYFRDTAKNTSELVSEFKPLVKQAQPAVAEFIGLESDLRGTVQTAKAQIPLFTGEFTATSQQFRLNLISAQGVTDGFRHQFTDPGGLVPNLNASLTSPGRLVWPGFTVGQGLIPRVTLAVGHLDDASLVLKRGLEGLPTIVSDLDNNLKDGDKIEISANGTITRFNNLLGERILNPDGTYSGTGLTGIAENINGMSADSRLKLHQIFWPPPPKGFLGHLKYGAEFILNPILEGGRIYFQLKALPVRIVNPIPQAKP